MGKLKTPAVAAPARARYGPHFWGACVFNLLLFLAVPPIFLSGAVFYPVRLVSRRVHRVLMRLNETVWGAVIAVLTRVLLPSRLVFTGAMPPGRAECRAALVVANHQIYADWWYLWLLAHGCGRDGDVKIVLKRSLRAIPVIGWAMRAWEFVFLHRDAALDAAELSGAARSFREGAVPLWLVIFPEGTVHSTERREVMAAYAAKAGRSGPLPKHTLLPRATGLHLLRDGLAPHLTHVIDVTMAYGGTDRSCDVEKLYTLGAVFHRGNPPPEVHMHVRIHDAAAVPRDREGLALWIEGVFEEKNRLLEEFYAKGKFPGATFVPPRRATVTGAVVRMACAVIILAVVTWWIRAAAAVAVA
jgi:1-acyl-sn-glycerol-3-phosphate acyltransferase